MVTEHAEEHPAFGVAAVAKGKPERR